jgi:adenine specific DNA methylase Mod
MDEQNHSLMERNQQIENEYRKVLAFRTLMDSYKNQVAMLETKNNELIREKNKMEYDIQQMTKKVDLLEVDKTRDSERILSLEDHLQEYQLGGKHTHIYHGTSLPIKCLLTRCYDTSWTTTLRKSRSAG